VILVKSISDKRKVNGKYYTYNSYHLSKNKSKEVQKNLHVNGFNAVIIELKNKSGKTIYSMTKEHGIYGIEAKNLTEMKKELKKLL